MSKWTGLLVLLLLAVVLLVEGKFVLRKYWTRCPHRPAATCTQLGMVACARNRYGTLKQYDNSCLACHQNLVLFVKPGTCL